jgi:hypothetical protein
MRSIPEQFELWRRHHQPLAAQVGGMPAAGTKMFTAEEALALYLKEDPDARDHREALLAYLRRKYPQGVALRYHPA